MAEIDVQPKKREKRSMWPWLLGLLGLIALIFLLTRDRDDDDNVNTAETYSNTTNNAANRPDAWSAINWNAPRANYDEVTGGDVDVRTADNYAIYGVNEEILFDKDQSTLRNGADQSLQQIVGSINKRYNGGDIRIYGFTDAEGSEGYNKDLSQKRAETVKEWLKKNGLKSDDISIHAMGEGSPAASNNTEAGKQQNRRVQIVAMAEE